MLPVGLLALCWLAIKKMHPDFLFMAEAYWAFGWNRKTWMCGEARVALEGIEFGGVTSGWFRRRVKVTEHNFTPALQKAFQSMLDWPMNGGACGQ